MIDIWAQDNLSRSTDAIIEIGLMCQTTIISTTTTMLIINRHSIPFEY